MTNEDFHRFTEVLIAALDNGDIDYESYCVCYQTLLERFERENES